MSNKFPTGYATCYICKAEWLIFGFPSAEKEELSAFDCPNPKCPSKKTHRGLVQITNIWGTPPQFEGKPEGYFILPEQPKTEGIE